MTRPAVPSFRLAPLGALALLVLLAGCGIKGPLEPPPAAAPPQAQLDGQPVAPPPPVGDAPQPLRKRIFLDWLLD